MKTKKHSELSKDLSKVIGLFITAVICFGLYRWGTGHEKVCSAITLASAAYLVLCLFEAVFKNVPDDMAQKIISGFTVIGFANELYDYSKMIAIFPMLKNINQVVFYIILIGTIFVVFVLFKAIIFCIEGNDSNTNHDVDSLKHNKQRTANSVNEGNSSGTNDNYTQTGNVNEKNFGNTDNNGMTENKNYVLTKENNTRKKTAENNSLIILYFVFLSILIGGVALLFTVLYKKGILNQHSDFFEIVTSLLKYAGSVLMFLIAGFVVIVLIIEMFRMIISRMKAFVASLRNDSNNGAGSLYLLSIIIDIIVYYLTYKFTGFNMESFYEFVKEGKYLALPLTLLFLGIAFIIFLRLIHATLLLLTDMKPETIKNFLYSINNSNRITERLVKIIKIIIDTILDTIITALKVVYFVPDFLGTICAFVIDDEEELDQNE